MKIKITELNKAKIQAALFAINGKAISHTAGYEDIFMLASKMENKLDNLEIAKKDRAGATATGMSGGCVPTAYKYSRTVNRYKIERKSDDWFLTFITRDDIYGNALADRLTLLLSQKDIAVAKFTARFSVQTVVDLAVAA